MLPDHSQLKHSQSILLRDETRIQNESFGALKSSLEPSGGLFKGNPPVPSTPFLDTIASVLQILLHLPLKGKFPSKNKLASLEATLAQNYD